MPLGFARSVLTASAAAPTGAFAFYGHSRSVTSTPQASYNVTMTNRFADSSSISIVLWVRIQDHTTEREDSAILVAYFDSNDTGGGQLRITANELIMNIYNGSTNVVMYSRKGSYQTAQNFQDNFCDGAWHCVMAAMDMSTGANRKFYIDGEEVTTNNTENSAPQTQTSATKPDFDDVRFVVLRYQPTNYNSSAYGGRDNEFGGDMGPIWIYDSYIDFTNATTRGYYYNVANADGFVSGGTDGTNGGATQPDLYLYHTDTTLLNGGTLNNAVNLATVSSGAINVIPQTEGPGSGHTR